MDLKNIHMLSLRSIIGSGHEVACTTTRTDDYSEIGSGATPKLFIILKMVGGGVREGGKGQSSPSPSSEVPKVELLDSG